MDTGLSLLGLMVGRETASIMAETGNSAEEKKIQQGMRNGDDHKSPQQCRHVRMYVASATLAK